MSAPAARHSAESLWLSGARLLVFSSPEAEPQAGYFE
jgi:hypothetical protein